MSDEQSLVGLTFPVPGVALLTLDLPARRNAMTTEMTAAWTAAVDEVRARSGAERGVGTGAQPSVRCVVVTGAGPAFCAGGDLSWIGETATPSVVAVRERMIAFYRTWLALRELEVPTIAAVNGAAVGAGLALALSCDIRYVSTAAALSAPFTSLGLHPGMATTWLLPETVGIAAARDLLLTGRVVRGADAVAMGLASAAYAPEVLLEEALAAAARVVAAAPVATRLTKLALARGGHASLPDALEWEALAQAVTLTTDDLREGLAAQRERRPPRFQGK